MRRQRPQDPWPFSVPQDELAYRLRLDGWTLLQVGYDFGNELTDVTKLSERYRVSRPTIYRWLARTKRHWRLIRELEEFVSEAKEALDERYKAKLVPYDDYVAMRRVIGRHPVESARRFKQDERDFFGWLRQEAFG